MVFGSVMLWHNLMYTLGIYELCMESAPIKKEMQDASFQETNQKLIEELGGVCSVCKLPISGTESFMISKGKLIHGTCINKV